MKMLFLLFSSMEWEQSANDAVLSTRLLLVKSIAVELHEYPGACRPKGKKLERVVGSKDLDG